MTDVTNRYLPPPRNWQDFERLCYDLYRAIWKTSDAHLHGRSGQEQYGVDIYGTDRIHGLRMGVQCKGKSSGFGGQVTPPELKREAKAAEAFQPPLDLFILATTAENDRKIQQVARELTERNREAGLFEVHVVGWAEIQAHLAAHPEVLAIHFPDLAPTLPTLLRDAIAEEGEKSREHLATQITKLSSVAPASGMMIVQDAVASSSDRDALGLKIDAAASLLPEAPALALTRLRALWVDTAATASDQNRYRMQANIGAALVMSGEASAAAGAFRAAHAEAPDTGRGLAALASAEHIEGRHHLAFETARATLALDPMSDRAARILLASAAREISWEALRDLVPKTLRNRADVQVALAGRAQSQGALTDADRLIDSAIRREGDDWRVLGSAGVLLVERVATTRPAIRYLRNGTPAEYALLARAEELLGRAWEIARGKHQQAMADWVGASRANLLLARGANAEADEVLREAREACPRCAAVLKVAAARALERDAADEAIRCIEAIPHADHDQNDEMVLCQAELALGRSRQALNRARTIETSAADPKLAVAAASLRILAASELGPAQLEAEFLEVLPRYREAPSVLALAAERIASEDPRHQEFLDVAADGTPALTDDFEKDRVARLLFAAGRFAEAADLLVGLHGDTVDTPQLRLHLRALLQAERRAEARDSFERLAPRLRNDTPDITRLGSWIYEELGRLSDAHRLIERVLASGQGQLRDRLHWIALCERIPDVGSAKAFLRDLGPSVAGTPEELMVLAQAVDRLIDDPRKALELGYRALRAGYDIAKIHLAYVGGLVFMGRAGRLGMPTHSKVEPDSAVVMKSDVRGEIVRIIETSPDPDITRNEIAADDPFAQRLLGKVVGDEIEMEAVGIGRHTARIVEIRSKYLEAHFRALADFERMFPEHRALGSIKMRDEATEDDLKPVFAMARRRADAAAQIRQIYGRGVAPIPLLAAMGGGSALDLWDDLLARPNVRLLASLGVVGEPVPVIDALRAGERALLIDPVTLYALSRLGIADEAVAAVPGLCIVRSGIDMLMAARREREIHQGEKTGSLVADGEGFRFVEATQAQIDAAIAEVDKTLALARSLPVIAPEHASELHPETQELLASADTHVLDTLRAAKERGAILLTDDLALRRLAQVEDVLSVWTQPLLAEARRTARISQAAYVEAVLVLIDAGYRYVSLDASILFEEWRHDGFKVGARLAALIDHLADPDNEPGSVASVLSELLLLGFSGEPEPQHVSDLLQRIAARLRAHLGDERTASLLARAREGVIDFHRLSRRRRRLPARLLASTSLRSVASLAHKLDAEVNREFDMTYGRLIDAAISA